jgi:Gpi18-like mannosyltransferase
MRPQGASTITRLHSSTLGNTLPPRTKAIWPLLVGILLVIASAYVRIVFRDVITTDLDFHILPWFAKLQKHGPFVGLGKDFYNYTPPYLYLLAIGTVAARWLAPVIIVKLISTAFDIACGYVIYRIVRLWRAQGYLPHLAAAVFFAAPTVVANTGIWGQADSTFMLFILLFLYLMLVGRPLPSMLALGVALAFKPQAIFFGPFVLLMLLWRKIRWFDLAAIPIAYAASMLPAVLAGRTWTEVLTVYANQAGSGKALTHNAATLYVFIPKSAFSVLLVPAIALAFLTALAWVYFSWRATSRTDKTAVLLAALISASLTPFFLPNMHDRYFFAADVISILLAFAVPAFWIVAFLFQLSSGLSYSIYLLSATPDVLPVAAACNIAILLLLLGAQGRIGRPREPT